MGAVLAVDPGRAKCGVAVVSENGVLAREVCSTLVLLQRVRDLALSTGAVRILVGGGTNGRKMAKALSAQEDLPPVEIVSEEFSTLDAKKRYFEENPSHGMSRLIPQSLRIPREPVDDWAAVILAERGLAQGRDLRQDPKEDD